MRRAAAIACVALALAGCGTRAGEAEVRAGARAGGEITLTPESLEALRAGPAAGAVEPGTPADLTPLPGAVGPIEAPTVSQAPATVGRADDAPVAAPERPGRGRPSTAAAPVAPPAQPRCTGREAPVALGQVGTFSGIAGPIAGDALTTLAVWAKQVNAAGGLACHPVTVFVQDDGADPARAAVAARELVNERGVVAFVGNILALTLRGFLPEIAKDCIPTIGADLADPQWATHPCLYPQGGGIDEGIAALVVQAVESGHTRLGLLYCVEASTCAYGNERIGAVAKARGAELVYTTPITLTQTDFTAQCQNAKNAGVEELIVAMGGSAMARLARSCKALDYAPLLVSAGLTVSPAQSEDPALREFGLVAVNPVAPWFATDQPGLREYQAALKRYAPQVVAGGASGLVWAAAKLLEAGVARLGPDAAGKPLTSAAINAGLRAIKNETLGGLTAPLDFTGATKLKTSGCAYLALLTPQGWTAPRGTRPLCDLLPEGTR